MPTPSAPPSEPSPSNSLKASRRPPLKVPVQGRISHVTGRKGSDGRSGLPAIDQLSFRLSNGTTYDFGPPNLGQPGKLELLSPIYPASFLRQPGSIPMCPICLEGDAKYKEHVPQKDLGGAVMTMTCSRCNNDLGSRVELDLQQWFDHALVDVAFDHDGNVPGRRRMPPIYYRETADASSFALVVHQKLRPEIMEMLASGEWRMHYRQPDPRRYRMALLKHAYLAACLYLHRVPDSPDARAIRADLLAARNTSRRVQPPERPLAERLSVYRSHAGTQGPALALVTPQHANGGSPREILISLAGVLFVSWPFTDLPPGTWITPPSQ